MHSYPDWTYLYSALWKFIVDLNLRKSWSAMRSLLLSNSPSPKTSGGNESGNEIKEAVIFLGDMMDNGRADMSDEEFVQLSNFL